MLTFGQRDPKLQYWRRHGVYAVILNEHQHFLCVEDSERNLYLVGGKKEVGETASETLLREALEETGYRLHVHQKIGAAEKHWVSAQYARYSQHNLADLYLCQLHEKCTEPLENEKNVWVDLATLKKRLFHEHHLHLIQEFLKQRS